MKINSKARRVDAADFPTNGSAEEKWIFLLRYARLAASPHKIEPWLFEIHGNELRMFCSKARALPEVDQKTRGSIISCGAALLNLRLAIHYFGHSAVFQVLPVPADQHFLVRLYLGGPVHTCLPGEGLFHTTRRFEEQLDAAHGIGTDEVTRKVLIDDFQEAEHDLCGRASFEPTLSDGALFHAMLDNRINHRAWLSCQPTEVALEGCFNGALCTDAWFHVISDSRDRKKIVELIAQSEREQIANARGARAVENWIRPTARHFGDGSPVCGLGFNRAMTILASGFPKFRQLIRRDCPSGAAKFAADAPVLAIIGTEEDSPAAWVEAGGATESEGHFELVLLGWVYNEVVHG